MIDDGDHQKPPIYLISMKSDVARRTELRRRFGSVYDSFTLIEGVQGIDKPPGSFRPRAWRDPNQKELATRQIGCALSHVRALERFLESKATRCLILEDDVIGDPQCLHCTWALMGELPQDAFVLLGGQEGLRGRRYLAGIKLMGLDAWRLPQISRQFAARAVSYGVTRNVAEIILARQKACLDNPDQWDSLLQGHRNVFFAEIFRHPLDLAASHIEPMRLAARRRPIFSRILEDGIWVSVRRNLSKLATVTIFPLFGVTRIPSKQR